jgi:hypothetical protein
MKNKQKAQKVVVTEKALYQRINRKLNAVGRALKRTRGQRALIDLGQYYVLDVNINAVLYYYHDVNLEDFGRELGVLKPYEALEEVQ